jgi:putative phosphoribosyl transferase
MVNVRVPVGREWLDADLGLPAARRGVVVFAHGSGSGRHSPRNRFVARTLEERGLATVLADLLTEAEEQIDQRTGHLRFDIERLANRLIAIIEWVWQRPEIAMLPIGLFGASTGAAAALVAAAELPSVRAVVSRGGRPDLAGAALPLVSAPTLLIVGSLDTPVLDMNRDAMARMRGAVELAIVPGATHLFEEEGTLGEAAALARAWFERYLRE